jgi:hypothetical protein
VRRASAGARPRRAVGRVAVVANELNDWLERAGGAHARAAAGRRPAQLARKASGACVPIALRRAERRHKIHRGAVAVGVVTGLARRGDAEAVALQGPEDIVVDPGVHGLRGAAAGVAVVVAWLAGVAGLVWRPPSPPTRPRRRNWPQLGVAILDMSADPLAILRLGFAVQLSGFAALVILH